MCVCVCVCVCVCMLSHFSHVQLFVTLWAIAHQTTLSIGFSRQDIHITKSLCCTVEFTTTF